MSVSRSATAVRFTVTSDEYVDNPGSTITFRTVVRAGNLYLQQQARSTGVELLHLIGRPIIYLGAAHNRSQHAHNYRGVVKRAGMSGRRAIRV